MFEAAMQNFLELLGGWKVGMEEIAGPAEGGREGREKVVVRLVLVLMLGVVKVVLLMLGVVKVVVLVVLEKEKDALTMG